MSVLIIGGLLVVGVGALVALFFVIRGEQNAASAPAVPSKAASESQESQERQEAVSEPEMALVPTAAAESAPEEDEDVQQIVVSAGQFYELSNELRLLRQQIQGLEQRLGSITALVSHFQESQREEHLEHEGEHILLDDPAKV